MNEKDINNKIGHLLSKAHPSEPSPLLKERITAEARKVWKQTSMEMPWQIPMLRFVASAAAAVVIISITNFTNDHALKKWHPRDAQVTREQHSDLEILPEMPVSPFVRRLSFVNRRPSIIEPTTLRDYTERLQKVLNELQQNGASKEQVPDRGRSRLFPSQPGSDYYS